MVSCLDILLISALCFGHRFTKMCEREGREKVGKCESKGSPVKFSNLNLISRTHGYAWAMVI